MATISENIQRINKAKTDIKNAIIAKGGSVADGDKIDTYATAIESLPSGGGAELPQNLSRLVTDDWGNPKKITIKGSVEAISDNAFKNGQLEDVIIGNGVTSIGDSAFRDCYSLSSVVIPDSVTTIKGGAFVSTKITSIVIPDSVTSIGDEAFYHCQSLTGITLSNNVTSINRNVFRECSALRSITIPDSVTSIGESAFSYCSALRSITIPDNVTSIGSSAFKNCYALTSVTIPNSVTSIGDEAFNSCTNLTSINIPKSVTAINTYAFYYNYVLKKITLNSTTPPTLGNAGVFINTGMCPIIVPTGSGDAYKSASYWSYYANRIVEGEYVPSFEVTELRYTGQTGTTEFTTKDITEITTADTTTSSISTLGMAVIGDKVANIGNKAFNGATSLGNVYFSDNSQLKTIGAYAFNYCQFLTNIAIPDSVTFIGAYAFNNCDNLSEITVKAATPPIVDTNAFYYRVTAIYVPSDSVNVYKSAWSKYADKIQAIQE